MSCLHEELEPMINPDHPDGIIEFDRCAICGTLPGPIRKPKIADILAEQGTKYQDEQGMIRLSSALFSELVEHVRICERAERDLVERYHAACDADGHCEGRAQELMYDAAVRLGIIKER